MHVTGTRADGIGICASSARSIPGLAPGFPLRKRVGSSSPSPSSSASSGGGGVMAGEGYRRLTYSDVIPSAARDPGLVEDGIARAAGPRDGEARRTFGPLASPDLADLLAHHRVSRLAGERRRERGEVRGSAVGPEFRQ